MSQYRVHHPLIALAVAALGLLGLFEFTPLDLAVARLFWDPAAGTFSWRGDPTLEPILYHGAKAAMYGLGVVALVVLALAHRRTADVAARDLLTIVAEDAGDKKSDRTLWPFEVIRDGEGKPKGVRHKGSDVAPDRRLTIAFNSYDAQSGGRRLMKLREILQRPASELRTTSIDTRGALIEGLLDRGAIG